jgi:hypothetical protein
MVSVVVVVEFMVAVKSLSLVSSSFRDHLVWLLVPCFPPGSCLCPMLGSFFYEVFLVVIVAPCKDLVVF